MSWLSDTTANRTKKSYFNGFVDISGGDLYVRHGNSSIDGSLNIGDNVGIKTGSAPSMSLDISATDGIRIPAGSDAQRPVQNNDANAAVYEGTMRFNTDTAEFEGYSGGIWRGIGGAGSSGVTNDQGTATISATNNAGTFPNSLVFEAGGQRRMVVGGDGNVLIEGDLSMSGTLDVANFYVGNTVADKVIASEYLSVTGTSSFVDEHPGVGVRVGNKALDGGQYPTFQLVSDISSGAHLDFLNNNLSDGENNYHGRLEFKHGSGDSTQGWFMSFSDTIANDISDDLYQFRPDEIHSRKPITINETGTGTAAGHSSGSILLKRSSNNGKSSIVFDSTNSGDDFAYIEFQDEGGSGSGSANGQLTIGVQNDTSDAAKERIRFDIAGAYAYLQMHDDGAGGNLGSLFSVDAISYRGIYPESYNLNTVWGTTLDYYNTSGSDTDRYTMYQYFNHTQVDVHDMALVGYNAGSSSGVSADGNVSYGYMYRSRGAPNKFIAFQTRGLRYNDDDTVNGMRLGVNAVPGYTYDFAVGGKSYLGNDVDISGDLTVSTGAGIFTGSTNINSITAPSGVYLGNNGSVGNQDSIIQMTSTGDHSVIDFTRNGASGTDADREGRIMFANGNHSSNPYQLSFTPRDTNSAALTLKAVSSGVLTATVDGDIRSTRNLDVSGSAVVDNNLTVDGITSMNNTLTINETGAGTAASSAGGTITLSHTNVASTGKSSIVFKSATDAGDYAYIQFEDDGGIGSGDENGLLTIGVQNDTNNYGGSGTTRREQIKFDVAGASAYLEGLANSTGGNKGSSFTPGAVFYEGIHADAYPLDQRWGNTLGSNTLTAYDSTTNTIDSAVYQYFGNSTNWQDHIALTGMIPDYISVDNVKVQGYMLRSRYSGYIGYQTQWYDPNDGNPLSGTGLRFGVNAFPGKTYDFAVGGKSHFGNTLTITETGAGTAASATGGTLTLQHNTSDGTGKNSIVFKSASDSGSDYGYIQYHDDGTDGSGKQNGLLTIGVQNDAVDWGQGITNADQIKFDVAGASAYLEARANSTGGNLASLLKVGSGYFTGIYSDAFDISDAWNAGALNNYTSTSLQDRFALYQYFDNASDDRQDMALVGFTGGSDDAVDGSKPYGYMYRCSRTPNRFIAFQTIGLEGSNDSRGMKLGVSAYPGVNYDFAVGGTSYFGNNVDILGNLTVSTGAGIFTGESTGYNSTTSPAGIYIGKFVSGVQGDYASMQFVSNNVEKKSWIDFTNTGVSSTYTDFEGRIVYYGDGGTDAEKAILFYPHGEYGGYMKVQSIADGQAEVVLDGMFTLYGGVASNVRDYGSISYWNSPLLCGNDYRGSWPDARTANYFYLASGYTSNHDLLLTGHVSGGGGRDSVGYNLYAKAAVNAGVTDQGLCIQTEYDGTHCFRLGLGNRPATYQFLTTGDVKVGGKLDMAGTLNISESTAGTAASSAGGTITLSHTNVASTGKSSIVFKSATDAGDYAYIQFEDDGGIGSGDENGLLTIGVQNDTNNYGGSGTVRREQIKFDVAGASAYLEGLANSTGGNKGSSFTPGAVFYEGIHADAYPLDTIWGTTLTGYGSVGDTDRSALYQYFDNAAHENDDLAFTGMNAGSSATVDGSSKPYGYMLRTRSDGYIAYQTAWLDGDYNDSGLALGVNALPGRYYDFAVGGKSHFGNDVDMCGNLTVGVVNYGTLVQTSDLTLKTDIVTLENSLDKICRLRGVSYRMKEDYDASSNKQLGMIAQEVEVEYPELVLEMQKNIDRDGVNEKYKGLNYANLTAPMIEAIKELKIKNDALETKCSTLETKCSTLETKCSTLETAHNALVAEHNTIRSEVETLKQQNTDILQRLAALEGNA